MEGGLLGIRSRRGAYTALAILTLIWGSNWLVMKTALEQAHPVVLNLQRTWIAVALLFGVILWRRRLRVPRVWWPVVVTGFFQTTLNFGATTMALAEGGAGRQQSKARSVMTKIAEKTRSLTNSPRTGVTDSPGAEPG